MKAALLYGLFGGGGGDGRFSLVVMFHLQILNFLASNLMLSPEETTIKVHLS